MSGYEKIDSIRAEVENFKNAKFFSMDGEKAVIIENTVTGCRFSVPFEESEGGIIFDGEKAVQVKSKNVTIVEEFEQNKKSLHDTIHGIFEDGKFEESVNNLKKLITELPPVDQDVISAASVKSEETKPVYEGILAEKVNAYYALEKEYKKSFDLFDEEQNVMKSKIGAAPFKKMEQELNEEIENFYKVAKSFQAFKEDLNTIIQDEKVREKLLSDVDLMSDISITVPKSLVVAKNTINEELNVMEASSKVLNSWKTNFFGEDLNPALSMDKVYNFAKKDQDRPKFLKFHAGVFSIEDAICLAEELDHAMGFYLGDLTDEDLMFIANQKQIVEYMVRTRKVSDRVMQNLIEDFNKRFAGKNVEDEYLQSQRGFKSREDAIIGNPQGYADRKVEA